MSFLQLRSSSSGNQNPGQPVVTTSAASNITSSSFDGNGNVTSDRINSAVTERGFVYSSTSLVPNIVNDSKVTSGSGTGSFTQTVGSLSPSTLYYFRAYATNADGTSYGDVFTATTQASSGATPPEDWPIFMRNGFWGWRYAQ